MTGTRPPAPSLARMWDPVLQSQCPVRAPMQSPAPFPQHRDPGTLVSPGPQLPPQGEGLHGHRLARRCGAEGPVVAQGCGPCPVTGCPLGASNCSQRQNNARRAARAPRAAPQHPAQEPPPLPQQGQPHAGVPWPLAAAWPVPVAHSGKLCWLLLSCGTALHGMARHGIAWHGTALHGTARHCTARHCMAQHGIAWHSIAWHSTALHGMGWHSIAWHGTALSGL